MRLLLLIASLVVVGARRGVIPVSPNQAPPFHPPKKHCLDPWGYPYGWGLDDNCFPAEDPDMEFKQMKEVKRVTPHKDMPTPPPMKKTGWFGVKPDKDHPHWKDVDEVMDGFE